jgi:hypothetical protein
METEGPFKRLNDMINLPDHITTHIVNAYQEMVVPRLVLLVPIRCEKWLGTRQSQQDLLRRIKQSYRDLISFLSNSRFVNNVAVVIAPVNTIGSVEFSHIGSRDDGSRPGSIVKGDYEFYFHAVGDDWRPEYADQLMRYPVSFAMAVARRSIRKTVQEENAVAKGQIATAVGGSLANRIFNWLSLRALDFAEPFETPLRDTAFRDAMTRLSDGRQESLPFEIVQGQNWFQN